jgi:hypothetical protein
MKNKRFAGVLAAVFLVVAVGVANHAGGATNTLYLFGFLY